MVSNLNKLKNKMWYPGQDMNVQMGPGQSRWMKPMSEPRTSPGVAQVPLPCWQPHLTSGVRAQVKSESSSHHQT